MALILFEHNIVDEYKEISKEDKEALEVLNFVGSNNRAGLSVRLTQKNILKESTESTEIIDVVKINTKTAVATEFIRQTASNEYKKVSEVLNTVKPSKKANRKKSMKELMQESVFHGKSWLGSNFIA